MKVLVAIEDKKDASALVESIRNRPWPSNTQFVLVHVVGYGSLLWDQRLLDTAPEELEYESRSAYRLLLDTASRIKKFVPDAITETYVCYGTPTQELLTAVNETHPNVIIIGTHCRNKLEQVFHKSVSEQIVRHIPTAVDAVHIVEIPETQLSGSSTK